MKPVSQKMLTTTKSQGKTYKEQQIKAKNKIISGKAKMPQVNQETQREAESKQLSGRWNEMLGFWNGQLSPLDKPLFTGAHLSVYLLLITTQFIIPVY